LKLPEGGNVSLFAQLFRDVRDRNVPLSSMSKFWEVWVSGHEMTTRRGRIGSAGQSKTKAFADALLASASAAKLIEGKTGDGYVEKGAL
jgi:predicted DNA-binding WGR domain protein